MNQINIFFNEKKKLNFFFTIFKILFFIIIYKKCIKKNNENILIMRPLKELEIKLFENSFIVNNQKLLKLLSIKIGKNISFVNSLFLTKKASFENLIMIVNNAIFCCEILECKNIILDDKYYWFIKKKIRYKKYKIIIKKGDHNNLNQHNLIMDKTYNLLIINL